MFKLSREAYEKLIREDINWLRKQHYSLEREHILMILERSADWEYGTMPKEEEPFGA